MLVVLRIIFGAVAYSVYQEAKRNAQLNPMTGDLANAYWTVAMVLVAIANGVVWAPYIGDKIADPLTGSTINADYRESNHLLMKMIRFCEKHRLKRFVCWFCFLEGVRAPRTPTAFIIGMHNAQPGGWFEKIYAWEVFKFNNAQHCLTAYRILKGHGIDPRPHAMPGINLVLLSSDHEAKATPAHLGVPEAPPPPKLERNRRIDIGLQD